ncbi:hypothetical protein LOZ49_000380 [Ophidiomyces ophidiicola]|nr:hypothetical protein LOZ49_000380 [Ophidiomyces ophidiicola]KAI2042211.1 hypothetical protein LOZ44_006290 [Ophidiomyces ophidiicola]KAI2446300.1 hypothetical protein LOZ08_001131 [Ophidiomyces ophidiicola]
MFKLKSVGHKDDTMDSHDRTAKHRQGKMLTGPGSHFTQARAGRAAMKDFETRIHSAGERRPFVERGSGDATRGRAVNRVSRETYDDSMAIGTTSIDGDAPTESSRPTRYKSSPPAAPKHTSTRQKTAPPPLTSSRSRSLGVQDEQGAAVAAAASAYCTGENFPKTPANQQQPFAAEVVKEEYVEDLADIDTVHPQDEGYGKAEWNDDVIIEEGGLTAALPIDSEIDERDSGHWEVPATYRPSSMVNRPVSGRFSPFRYSTVIIGSAMNIQSPHAPDQQHTPPHTPPHSKEAEVQRAQPPPVPPAYVIAVEQAKAEEAELEKLRRLDEEIARRERQIAEKKQASRCAQAWECAVLQAQAETEYIKRRRQGAMTVGQGRSITVAKKKRPFRRGVEPRLVPGTKEPVEGESEAESEEMILEEEDDNAGMVSGMKESSHSYWADNPVDAFYGPPAVAPTVIPVVVAQPTNPEQVLQEGAPSTMHHGLQEEAQMQPDQGVRKTKIPITEEPEMPISAQQPDVQAPSEPQEYHESPALPPSSGQGYYRQDTQPFPMAQETPEPVSQPAPVPVPVGGGGGTAGAAAPVAAAPTAANPSQATQPQAGKVSEKASRAERRRAEKEAKQRDKRLQKEEKDRIKAQKQQQDDVQRQMQNGNSAPHTDGQQQHQPRDNRRGSLIDRILGRGSSKPAEATNGSKVGGGAAMNGGTASGGGQQARAATNAGASPNELTDLPSMLRS